MNDKKCNKCGKIKRSHLFHKHPGMKDGRINRCKSCTSGDRLVTLWSNPELLAEDLRFHLHYINDAGARREQREQDTLDLRDEVRCFIRKVGVDEGGFNI